MYDLTLRSRKKTQKPYK